MIGEAFLRGILPGWMLKKDRAHWKSLMKSTLEVIQRTHDNIELGRLASMPGQIDDPEFGGFGSIEALPMIARDRRMLLGKKESPAAAAARLRYWRQAWRSAGTPYGLLSALRGVLYPMPAKVRLVKGGVLPSEGYWWTLDDTGLRYQSSDGLGVFWPEDGSAAQLDSTVAHAWDWDSETWANPAGPNPDPSRLWAIIYAPCGDTELSNYEGQYNSAGKYGDRESVTNDAYTIGTTATNPYVSTARAVCSNFKASGVSVSHIIVTFTPSLLDPADSPGDINHPDGKWKHHGRIVSTGFGYERVRARSTRGRYWLGTV
ncbi:MAG: hypothetical protein U0441_14940 [Polyangiaceae bacterium]